MDAYCQKCGKKLICRQDYGEHGPGWYIEPCAECLDVAHDEGYEEGYDRGYDDNEPPNDAEG